MAFHVPIMNDLFEHLSNLAQSNLMSELSNKINELHHSQPNLAKELAKLFGLVINEDDFEELFDSVAVKVCWGTIMVVELTFNNAFNFFFIMFDKYGEDSLKRSLNNQLISQVGYPVMLHNLIVVPSWTWRVFFGPLNTGWADTVVLIGNAITIWVSLCFTEALTIKAAMATR